MARKPEASLSSHPLAIKSRERRGRNREKNREYQRRVSYFYEYGMTYEEIESRKAEQLVCEICGEVPKRWTVDHDHTTGKFRGLLCDRCNKAIGMLGDTLPKLERVMRYLERTHNKK